MDRTANFYSGPSYIYGAGLPIYSGARRQRGGSIFGAIGRFIMPVLKSLGKKIMRKGASEAVGLAKDVVGDAFLGRNIKDSVVKHGKKRALDVGRFTADAGLNQLQQMIGSGRGRTRRRRRQGLGKRKRSVKKSKSRPRKKRRRANKPIF